MRTWWWLVVVILLLVPPVGATTLLPGDFAQMVSESHLIVHARVIAVDGALVGSRRTIESRVTVAVVSPLKGQTGPELVFRVPGGRVGRYRRLFVGAPTFDPGDEVLLFLKGNAPSLAMPYGLSQGVYRVFRSGGGAVVMPVSPIAGAAGVPRGDATRRALPLEEFTRQVRAIAGAGR